MHESRRPLSWCFVTDADLGVQPAQAGSSDSSEHSGDPEEEEEEAEEASAEEAEESAPGEEETPAARKAKIRSAFKAAAALLKTPAADAKANAKAESKTKAKDKEGEAASRNTGGDEDDEPLISSGKKTGSRAAANAGAAGTKDRNKKAAGEPKKDIQLKAPSESAKKLGGESVALAKLVEAPAKTGPTPPARSDPQWKRHRPKRLARNVRRRSSEVRRALPVL